MKKRKYLFIDRDGTLIEEPPIDYQVDSLEKLRFEPKVVTALNHIVNNTDYRLVLVSNQDGLGTDSFPEDTFLPPQNKMLELFENEGVVFEEILVDPSFPADKSPNRKPEIGMVKHYLNDLLDRDNSYVIGDRITDVDLANNMGIKSIYYGAEEDLIMARSVGFVSKDWGEIAQFIEKGSRKITKERKSTETDIKLTLDLNGSGKSEITTGISFFDHMLEQIARHGLVDLFIELKGDLDVDEHHSIEDCGIVLGEAFNEVLGSKRGIERYGFSLPMDESQAKVLLDFGGRSHLVWKVELTKEYVGDFPTDMAQHFFASFCQGAKCNLQIEATGKNMHHLLEAIFKAFAKSIKQAITKGENNELPSSKGIL